MAWRLFALALAVLVVVPVALAQEEDRVRLTPPGFSSTTVVTVPVLAEFRRTGFDGDSGSWEGPTCERPPFSAPIALTWGVGFSQRRSAQDAATAARTFRWTVVESGAIEVRHLVGSRDVGAIPGTFVVTDSQSPQGWHEAGLGFPIGRGFYAGAGAWSRGNGFACIVRSAQGPVSSATWHRQTSGRALQGIRLEGSLPPARVTARGLAQRVAGTVRDSFGHPVAAASVTLQRRVSRAWRRVAASRTTARGSYAIRTRRRGRYRAVATLAGSSARSGVVLAGR
ncbi:MAG: hypothetical protein ACRDKU_02825 [Gaiellaceae bacterium]